MSRNDTVQKEAELLSLPGNQGVAYSTPLFIPNILALANGRQNTGTLHNNMS